MNFTEQKESQLKNLPRIAVVSLLHALLFIALINEVRVKPVIPPYNPVTIFKPAKPIPLEPTDVPVKQSSTLPPLTSVTLPPISDTPFHVLPIPTDKPFDPVTPLNGGGGNGGGPNVVETPHKIPLHLSAIVNASACDKPEYPAASARSGEEGIVTLAMLIGLDGRVLEANVEKSSGFKALDRAAKLGLSLCKFKPASTDGIPEKSWTKIQYAWKID